MNRNSASSFNWRREDRSRSEVLDAGHLERSSIARASVHAAGIGSGAGGGLRRSASGGRSLRRQASIDTLYGPSFYRDKTQWNFARIPRTLERLAGFVGRQFEVSEAEYQHICSTLSVRPPSGRSIFRLPLIPPTARLSVAWWILMLVIDATYTAFAVPIGAAFCTYRGGGDDDARADASSPGVGACSIVELVFGAIFVLNLFLSLATGMIVTCEYKAHDVLDGHLVARIYTRRAQFYIDLLSVLPFIYRVVLFAAYGAGSELNVLWVEQLLRALTLMRMGRILKFASLSKLLLMDATSGQILSRYVSAPLLYTIVLSYGLAVAINLIAMIFVMIAFGEGVSNSWMTSWAKLFAPDLTTASQTTQYLAAVYWMVVSATTTGFGDVTAQTVAELILQMVVLVVGMVLYGMLTATVTEALGRANTKAVASRAFQIKMADVAAWMSESRVPDKLQHAVFSYYAQVWTLRRGASLQAEVLQELPKFLRAKLSSHLTSDLVKAVPLFRDLPPAVQEQVAGRLAPVDLEPGDELCTEGDVADRLWFVEAGDMLAVKQGVDTECLSAPCLLGDLALLGDELPQCRLRPYTHRAVGAVRVWELPLHDLDVLFAMHWSLKEKLLQLMRNLVVGRLRHTLPSDFPFAEVGGLCEALVGVGRTEEAAQQLDLSRVKDGSLVACLRDILDNRYRPRVGGPWQQTAVPEGQPDVAAEDKAEAAPRQCPLCSVWPCPTCGLHICRGPAGGGPSSTPRAASSSGRQPEPGAPAEHAGPAGPVTGTSSAPTVLPASKIPPGRAQPPELALSGGSLIMASHDVPSFGTSLSTASQTLTPQPSNSLD